MTPYHYGIITGLIGGIGLSVWYDSFLRSRAKRNDQIKTISNDLKELDKALKRIVEKLGGQYK
jgi:hypothetical protein